MRLPARAPASNQARRAPLVVNREDMKTRMDATVEPTTGVCLPICVIVMSISSGTGRSVHLEVAVLQRHDAGFLPVFVAQVKNEETRNHQVSGDEIEPREHRRLEHADIGAEQHHHEQDNGKPRAERIEFRLELQAVEASPLCYPGLAETEVADGDAQPDEEAAQARRVVEDLIDALV